MDEGMDWRADVREAVTSYGHRNWILVADSAFPMLNSSGVKTVVSGREQETVLDFVVRAIERADHVRANVYVDAELDHVPDDHAPGIDALRQQLANLAPDAQRVPHEELIARVGEAGKEFMVLLVKTTSTLPYTTVFLELDCGYWDADREQALRAKLGQG